MNKEKILKGLYSLGLLGLAGIFTVIIVITYFSFSLPQIKSLNDYKPSIPSRILAKDGTILAEVGKEKRDVVQISDIPQVIIDAFLSAEDDGFFEHSGVDYLGIARAMLANLKAGRIVQGGSTITQQVAKSLLLSSQRSIARKIKDFLLAQKIEKHLTKQEILFLYLNQVYLGGGYYGIKTAVKGYFEKELEEVTPAEAAIIAGLLVAPGRYSPYIKPKAAIKRQRYVLRRMFETGKLKKDEYEAAVSEVIKFRRRKLTGFKAGYFTDWVRQRVIDKIGEEEFLNNGFTIKTTINWPLQKIAEEASFLGAKEIDKRQGFKGPLENIEEDKWHDFFTKQRKEIYDDRSEYFTIHKNEEIEYEVSLGETELDDLATYLEEEKIKLKNKRFYPGLNKEDPILNYIEASPRKFYKAIVTNVDDWARLVYVKVAGIPGIIPYTHFRWAHERVISDERNFYPYVIKPSTILKKGDVVHVTIQSKDEKLYENVTTDFKNYISKSRTKKEVFKQRYLLCMLDQMPDAQAALVALSPQTSEVISFVGGIDFEKSQFNRALQSKRQPGSAFKPILYAAGLENGYKPNSIIIDSPEALGGVDESLNWKPRNYDGKFKGPMTFRNALEVSRNIPTIKIAQDIGVDTIIKFVDRIGLNAKLDEDLSLSLGSFGVTLMDLTATYGLFPAGGKRLFPKSIISITDRDGKQYFIDEKSEYVSENEEDKVDPTPTPSEKVSGEVGEENGNSTSITPEEELKNQFLLSLGGDQVYDPRLSYIMTNILRGVVLHGTGRGAKSVSTFLGGKTGTTNNYVDAWFVGFSSNIVTGVWTGFDENETLGWGETGAKSALPIWKKFMAEGLKKYGEKDFSQPTGIINVMIDKETGRLARPGQRGAFREAFVEGMEPGAEVEEKVEDIEISDENPLDIVEDDEFYNNQ